MIRTSATLNTGKRCMRPSCGEYFSTTSNFDRHRKGIHGVDRRCVDPVEVGMVIRAVGTSTFWSMPDSDSLPEAPKVVDSAMQL